MALHQHWRRHGPQRLSAAATSIMDFRDHPSVAFAAVRRSDSSSTVQGYQLELDRAIAALTMGCVSMCSQHVRLWLRAYCPDVRRPSSNFYRRKSRSCSLSGISVCLTGADPAIHDACYVCKRDLSTMACSSICPGDARLSDRDPEPQSQLSPQFDRSTRDVRRAFKNAFAGRDASDHDTDRSSSAVYRPRSC